MVVPVMLLASAATATPPPEPAQLLAALRQPLPSRSAYFEQRESPLLSQALSLAGELERPASGVLVKRVDTPYRETARIEGEQVVVEREGKSARKFSLRRAPELRALTASIEAVLGGDLALLQRHFTLAMHGTAAAWNLQLTPLDKRLARKVGGLRFRGAGTELRCMELRLSGAEISRTWLGARADQAARAADAAARDALCFDPE
jgi:hypothetical protein